MSDRRKRRDLKLDPNLDPEVAEALASEEGQHLSNEIANKWDPDKLLRLVSAQAGKGERLDEQTRRRYEARLGVDLGDVRVFSGRFAEEVTKAHSAEALTVGGTGMIFMGDVASRSKATGAGRALLAHELTHIAQDVRGVHRRSTFGEATPLAHEDNEAEAEEAEAEELGAGAGGQPDPDAGKKREELLEKLFEKLVEHFDEEDRVWELRNGLPRFRT